MTQSIMFILEDASTTPEYINKSVLCITKNQKFITLKDTKTFINGDTKNPVSAWNFLVKKYNIKYWAYQYTLLNNLSF